MREETALHLEQAWSVTKTMHTLFHEALLAVYLHGSAVSGCLRPQSDIDLLAVIGSPMTEAQRKGLLSALLQISGRYPAPVGGPRCIEVMVFLEENIAPPDFPARAEFIYGEWLRSAFEAGELCWPISDPEHTLVLAQAAREAFPLFGPSAKALLPKIQSEHIRHAMRDALPALLQRLNGDERNVLLTLARMWRTAMTGEFVAKDSAATWAAARMPELEAVALNAAHEEYLGKVEVDWENLQAAARETAAYLYERVSKLL
ncbi:aminoglycoside adenylyltransferase domain-containing protein [Chelativorans sp. Marseille-P2723]|uniref:aminoglycoside adenylyltransferase domain-containing protein n=1 Tax=Chelativorans sp. Marseille-P2723 TaxID=2709133 RepID=UPI001FEE191D|nr:aminoglycoside adenylyltransferase domain-containing protein [Chelativorans sp. Marseille-P2723]